MGNRTALVWLLALLLPFGLGASEAKRPVSVTDDLGHEITLAHPARRIVSLAPHLTEILFALGVGDRIVGTVRYSDYPEAAKQVPRLGDAFSVNVEAVVALEPDLVFLWQTGGTGRAAAKLAQLGVPLYFNEAPTLESISAGVVGIATLVGERQRGLDLQHAFNEQLKRAGRASRPLSVFFQIADQNIYTVSSDHLIGQAITLCGGINPFADTTIPVPLVSKEAVLARAPDLVIITHVPGTSPPAWVSTWEAFPSLKGRLRTIDPDLISRPGLRMAEGISALCELIATAASP